MNLKLKHRNEKTESENMDRSPTTTNANSPKQQRISRMKQKTKPEEREKITHYLAKARSLSIKRKTPDAKESDEGPSPDRRNRKQNKKC